MNDDRTLTVGVFSNGYARPRDGAVTAAIPTSGSAGASAARRRSCDRGLAPRCGRSSVTWRDTNGDVSDRIAELRRQAERDLGGLAPIINRIAGPLLLWSARRDMRLAPAGRVREPGTFVERRNWHARS